MASCRADPVAEETKTAMPTDLGPELADLSRRLADAKEFL